MGECNGGKKGGGGGGGSDSVTSVIGQGGVQIDLTATPLVYGKLDPSISPAERRALEAQEDKRRNAAVEYAYAVQADGSPATDIYGNPLKEKRGGKGSCAVPYRMWVQDGTLTHNHPRTGDETGMLGGTFSTADIDGFASRGLRTMRAAAAEGTYSISKGKNFNSSGLRKYRLEIERTANSAARQKVLDAGERYKRGEISRTQLMKAATEATNAALVQIHNGLIAGQQQYGYVYTLERRA